MVRVLGSKTALCCKSLANSGEALLLTDSSVCHHSAVVYLPISLSLGVRLPTLKKKKKSKLASIGMIKAITIL